ncbi:MAG TPA: uroporphyrinogen-III C-methyltransferase [Burkholderiales bacterium]|nr:uroporphyrinogen-III C-methyltransferase [Burkholderiales bacterium]
MSKKSKEEQIAPETKKAESVPTTPVSEQADADLRGQVADTENTSADMSQQAQDDMPAVGRRPGRGASGLIATLAILIALGAAGFSAWQAYELRRAKTALDLDLARKLAEIETIGSDSRRLSSGARDIARDVEARLGRIEAQLVGMQNQRLALESLYQDLSQSRDEWTLAEVEQILLVASQQLQLAGNVKAALIALEAADARLARSDRPQLTEMRRVIAEDIERLKLSPFVDVTGIGLKLDRIIASVSGMPLAMQTRPEAMHSETSKPGVEGWRQMIDELWGDLLGLVRIERIDAPETPPLAPEQSFFLRENLKLRLLGARFALLARDQTTYQADLSEASRWLRHYFDADAATVVSSIEAIDQLSKSDIVIELPDVGASLDAVRNYRLIRERTLR